MRASARRRKRNFSRSSKSTRPARDRSRNITDFGAFIDLGGVDGLLHITDMSWGRVSHPSELVALGDKIDVKILDLDFDNGRISLGHKQLTPYPWEKAEEKYPVGSKVRGKVVSITNYGAFVELEKGIEGLVHISEMSWTRHIRHPSKVVAIGDTVETVVLNINPEEEKISLGIKQLEQDPWETISQKIPDWHHYRGPGSQPDQLWCFCRDRRGNRWAGAYFRYELDQENPSPQRSRQER